MTAWPDRPMPVPRVRYMPMYFESEETPYFLLDDSDIQDLYEGFAVEIPDELFLRDLWDLDLEDQWAIEDFVSKFSVVGQGGMPDLPDSYGLSGVKEKIRALRRQHYPERPKGDPRARREEAQRAFAVHIEEFRLHVRALRDMTRIWLYQSGALRLQDVRRDWELPIPAPKSLPEALDMLDKVLTEGLKPFYPRLWLVPVPVIRPRIPTGHPEAGTYNALCLQLFNSIVEGIPPTRCANESCRRFFVRQQGRAESGQHRTKSVSFCSAACAQAHHARMLRRDKAQVMRLNKEGLSLEQIATHVKRKPATIERWLTQPKRRRSKKEG